MINHRRRLAKSESRATRALPAIAFRPRPYVWAYCIGRITSIRAYTIPRFRPSGKSEKAVGTCPDMTVTSPDPHTAYATTAYLAWKLENSTFYGYIRFPYAKPSMLNRGVTECIQACRRIPGCCIPAGRWPYFYVVTSFRQTCVVKRLWITLVRRMVFRIESLWSPHRHKSPFRSVSATARRPWWIVVRSYYKLQKRFPTLLDAISVYIVPNSPHYISIPRRSSVINAYIIYAGAA